MKNKALHKTAPDTHILTIVGLMVLALILMAILQPGNYFTLKNAKSMIFQFPEYGILAFGMMVCMIAGGIDLSLVGIMNFTGDRHSGRGKGKSGIWRKSRFDQSGDLYGHRYFRRYENLYGNGYESICRHRYRASGKMSEHGGQDCCQIPYHCQ